MKYNQRKKYLIHKTLKKWFSRKNCFDLIVVWLGTGIAAISGLLTQTISARILGAENFGHLSNAMSITGIGALIIVFGMPQYLLKVFGSESWDARRWLRPGIKFLFFSSLFFIVSLVFLLILTRENFGEHILILILLPVSIALASQKFMSSVFQFESNYIMYSILGVTLPILKLFWVIIVFLFFTQANNLYLICYGYSACAFILIYSLKRKFLELWNHNIKLYGCRNEIVSSEIGGATIRRLIAGSWIYGLAGIMYLAWNYGHVIIANYALSPHQAGIYSAALMVINTVCLLPSTAFSRFLLPKFHRLANTNLIKLRFFSRLSSIVMFASGLAMSLMIFSASPFIVNSVFGDGYDDAVWILRLLSLTLPMRFLGYNYSTLLQTKDWMTKKIKVLAVAVCFNLLFAFFSIPKYGLSGLALSVVVTEFFQFLVYGLIIERRYLKWSEN